MAYIDPDGLFHGDRMAMLSDQARLMWPYFWCASNTCGRIEIHYHRIMSRAFHRFRQLPTEEQFWKWIEEYWQASLLFVYQKDGHTWGQWEVSERYLPRHKLAADKRTPAPDHAEFTMWRDLYISSKIRKTAKSFSVTNSAEIGKCCVDKEMELELEKNPLTPLQGERENFLQEAQTPNGQTPEKPNRKRMPSLSAEDVKLFDRWWPHCWLKVAKDKALKPFSIALTYVSKTQSLSREQACQFLIEQADEEPAWAREPRCDWRERLHPPTWLNQKRWEDERPSRKPLILQPDTPSQVEIWRREKAAVEARGEEY